MRIDMDAPILHDLVDCETGEVVRQARLTRLEAVLTNVSRTSHEPRWLVHIPEEADE